MVEEPAIRQYSPKDWICGELRQRFQLGTWVPVYRGSNPGELPDLGVDETP